MHRTLPQFLIYATAHAAIALWRMLPGALAIAGFLALLALCEHGSLYLKHLFTH